MNNSNLMDVLTREGVLLKASVRYWRGCKKLKPEDLGLDPDNLSDRLISLGQKRLLPKDATAALALVERRVHSFVETNTFPFLNGLAHFVPNTKLGEVHAKLQDLEQEFRNAQRSFIESYGTQRDSALQEWRAMANKLLPDPERLLVTIDGSFPPAEALEMTFGFEIQMFQIAAPEHLGLDMVTLGDQQRIMEARQQAAQEAASTMRVKVEGFVADCVASLREQTAQLCEEMLESINSSQKGVHQKTLNRLLRFIEQFKDMNFVQDTVMEQDLDRVRAELLSRTAQEYRDSTYAQSQLKQGLSKLADKARQLAQADTSEVIKRFGELGRRKFTLAA